MKPRKDQGSVETREAKLGNNLVLQKALKMDPESAHRMERNSTESLKEYAREAAGASLKAVQTDSM